MGGVVQGEQSQQPVGHTTQQGPGGLRPARLLCLAQPPPCLQACAWPTFGAPRAPNTPLLCVGATFGVGSAVAHRAVDAVMGPRTVVHDHTGGAPAAPAEAPAGPGAAEGPCAAQSKAFTECMRNMGGEAAACQYYMEQMQACYRGTAMH
jgi:hypothetical protein